MTKPGAAWRVIGPVVILLVAMTGCRSASPPAAPAPPRLHRYAALGDSYASGEGLAPFEPDARGCHRSPLAYPRLVAAATGGPELAFVACAGSTVADVLGTRQLGALDPASDLVTVMVGGNDAGFADVVGACVIDPTPCRGLDAEVEATLARLGPTLEDAYRRIQARVPGARVLVVGYPQLVADPATANVDTCPAVASPLPGLRVTADDARWLRDKGARLSAVLGGAAKAAGVQYVDVAAGFAGHEACSSDPWLSGVVLTDIAASFHPTAVGQAELARLVERVITSS